MAELEASDLNLKASMVIKRFREALAASSEISCQTTKALDILLNLMRAAKGIKGNKISIDKLVKDATDLVIVTYISFKPNDLQGQNEQETLEEIVKNLESVLHFTQEYVGKNTLLQAINNRKVKKYRKTLMHMRDGLLVGTEDSRLLIEILQETLLRMLPSANGIEVQRSAPDPNSAGTSMRQEAENDLNEVPPRRKTASKQKGQLKLHDMNAAATTTEDSTDKDQGDQETSGDDTNEASGTNSASTSRNRTGGQRKCTTAATQTFASSADPEHRSHTGGYYYTWPYTPAFIPSVQTTIIDYSQHNTYDNSQHSTTYDNFNNVGAHTTTYGNIPTHIFRNAIVGPRVHDEQMNRWGHSPPDGYSQQDPASEPYHETYRTPPQSDISEIEVASQDASGVDCSLSPHRRYRSL